MAVAASRLAAHYARANPVLPITIVIGTLAMLIVNIQKKAKWLFSQLGQLVISVGLLSLVDVYNRQVPEIDTHQGSVVGRMKNGLIALDAFVADERINQDGPVLQCMGHVAGARKRQTDRPLTARIPRV